MHIVQNTPEKLIVRLSDQVTLANAIRRSVTEIPTLAVDEVEFHKNDSPLYDEVVAHRIGLIPLRTTSSMNSKTELQLKLNKTGPGVVVAGDLQGDVEIAYPTMPITLLEKGQELELVAIARLGHGFEHEKYTPGLCHYRLLANVTSKNPQVARLVEQSRGVIQPEKTKDGWICDLDEATVEEIERLDKGAVQDSKDLVLFIESFGQLSAKDIFIHALKVLNENLSAFERAMK